MKKPNVLVIMCDDLGYGDLSCMGSETVYTPDVYKRQLIHAGTKEACFHV